MTNEPVKMRKCPACRERAVGPAVIDYTADLDHDGRTYFISVPGLSVFRCDNCGNVQHDDAADVRITEALRAAAGLLSPDELRAGRESLGYTTGRLAGLIDIAEAVLLRWESGGQLQQRGYDKLLRAFFDVPEVRHYFDPKAEVGQRGGRTLSSPAA